MLDQPGRKRHQLADIVDRPLERALAGGLGKIAVFDLERRRAAMGAGGDGAFDHPLGQRFQALQQECRIADVDVEGGFGADGFVGTIRLDLALVDAARDPVIMSPDLAEEPDKLLLRALSEVEAGADVGILHLGRGHRADAEETLGPPSRR